MSKSVLQIISKSVLQIISLCYKSSVQHWATVCAALQLYCAALQLYLRSTVTLKGGLCTLPAILLA